MKICRWTEEERRPYAPTIVWEPSAEAFLESLIQEQEFCSDVFGEIEKALAGKVCQGEESQRVIIFSEDPKFPTLAVYLLEEEAEAERCIVIIGIGMYMDLPL